MRDLVVVGAGGFGREVLDVIEAVNLAAVNEGRDNVWRVRGIADDDLSPTHGARLARLGIGHLGSVESVLTSLPAADYLVAVGNPVIRRTIASMFDRHGWTAAALIHPGANVGSDLTMGVGVVICGGVQVSTNVTLGDHVHLNPGSIVGHDAVICDFVSVNPGAIISGEVRVGASTLVGAGSVVLQGLTVGIASTIGAAACVVRDVVAHSVVVGVPARPLQSRSDL